MHPEGNHSCETSPKARNIPKDHELRIVLPAKMAAVRRGLQTIKRSERLSGLPFDTLSNLEIILAEALNNVVKHAYSGHPEGIIELHLSRSEHELHCVICDTGQQMPNGALPSDQQADLRCTIADLPEGGFGWGLIRKLAHEVGYIRENGQNRLSFSMEVRTNSPPEA
ncbi:ATP-binding protein [Celeribacter halophilus]|uniref:Serine/threonine-protein kinase RsbW n=1 Tax=Celeribacter halophilus TaxID=576117 RepID=A0A1I3SZY9_9RHOB|nr:ATP-binding protein [Celeribacter halophilus]PZX12015.1 serine/threonine-protein kinase RsbW [Celeribacter halophilus]SFJ63822.1 serine/threonine-protein kinase RsbW [Celeribacter halophilus]